MSIVDFLKSRLDEDERAAHAASPATGGPPRAHADVRAKRRIVEAYAAAHREAVAALGRGAASGAGGPESQGALHALRKTVEHLAGVYAGHRDYDRSWTA